MKKIIFIFALLSPVFTACSGRTQKTPLMRSVFVCTPQVLDSECVKSYSGIVEENHEISLGFKTAGQIEKIYVKEGAYVRKGQLLAKLDDKDYNLGVQALQIQYDQLKDEVARTERLFKQKSVSANDYEKAKAGLEQLGVQLQVNKNKLEYTELYAPTDGCIKSVNFSPAEMVDAGTALFTLLDLSSLSISVDIPIDLYKERAKFTAYSCTVNGEQLSLRLESIVPKADGNQLYRMKLAFGEAKTAALSAGMNVQVGIAVGDEATQGGLALPLSSIFYVDGEPNVWALQSDSTIVRKPVALSGLSHQGKAVVSGGIDRNENIVSAGATVLKEGEKVKIVSQSAKTNVGGLL